MKDIYNSLEFFKDEIELKYFVRLIQRESYKDYNLDEDKFVMVGAKRLKEFVRQERWIGAILGALGFWVVSTFMRLVLG